MSYQEKKLRIAINPHLIDKNEAGREAPFVHGWENVELTVAELATSVSAGIRGRTAPLKPKPGLNWGTREVKDNYSLSKSTSSSPLSP